MDFHSLKDKKEFYDQHLNFANRTLVDYEISPGTKAKFNIIQQQLGRRPFDRAVDLGCSGNSILPFLNTITSRIYLDIARKPLVQYNKIERSSAIVGILENLPFDDASFDLVTALDVLEHVKNDTKASHEMVRILKPYGILLLTVPHRMKFYTYQDSLIGHYRRYEMTELQDLFENLGMRFIRKFGIYGQAMRVQMFQAANPDQMEENLLNLRQKYISNPLFRKIWTRIVNFGKFWMTLDAKYQPDHQLMNIGMIFQKKPDRRDYSPIDPVKD